MARLLGHAWAPRLATCLVGLPHSSAFFSITKTDHGSEAPNDGRGPLLGGGKAFCNLERSLGPRDSARALPRPCTVHPARHQSRELYGTAAVCVRGGLQEQHARSAAAADRDHGTGVALPWEYLTAVPWAGGRRVI